MHTEEVKSGARGPLNGIVVADLSRVLAGPYCTMLLADMGATVIKVESPGGDDTRSWMPPERDGVSTYYMSINRNKNAIALDFTDEKDLQTVYDIIDRADVLVENFKPGGLKKFGLDPETVAQRWPKLVHASITGFGTEQGASMPGYDLLAQAVSGMMTLTGEPDGEPQRAGVAIFDVMTGLHAALGVMGALHDRGVTGEGQHIGVNLLSSALSGMVNQAVGYVAGGNLPTRMGNDHPSLFPYGPLKASDGYLVVCCGNESQFNRLVVSLGSPELATDPRFSSMVARNEHRETLRELLETALSARTSKEWFDILQVQGIPCSPILDVGQGVQFAQDLGLTPVVQAGSDGTSTPTIKHPVTYSRSTISYPKSPPAIDQDRDQILQWLQNSSTRNS